MKKLLILSFIVLIATTASAQNVVKIRECVIANGVLQDIEAEYDQATGDKYVMLNGVRKKLADVYPPTGAQYAGGQSWYINSEAIVLNARRYVKYGLPRILLTVEVEKMTVYKGVNMYKESGVGGLPEVIYVPVRQGCEFQPYQYICGDVVIVKGSSNAATMQLTAKTTGLTGKIAYAWNTGDMKILKGENTATITVDIKDKKNGDSVEFMVTVSDEKGCNVSYPLYLDIKK